MRIRALIPQLRTTDLEASIAFYTQVLGLELAFRYEDFYAGIRAGAQVFHLKRVDAPTHPSATCARANTSTSTWKPTTCPRPRPR